MIYLRHKKINNPPSQMTRQQTEPQQPVLKAVGWITKLVWRDPKSAFIGVLCVILAWTLYEKRQDRLSAEQTTKYYQTVTDRILNRAIENATNITEIKTRIDVEDSLQRKNN